MVSLMKAIELLIPNINKNTEYIKILNNKIIKSIKDIPSIHINSTDNSIPSVINFSIKNIKPETLIHYFDQYEIYISTKSACSDTTEPSHSVYAVTKVLDYANSSIRVSLSHLTKEQDIDKFIEILKKAVKELSL